MKVSVYIESNLKQINLVPENEYERNILNSIKDDNVEVSFQSGSFSECQGGYVRRYNQSQTNSETFFMVIKEKGCS